MKRPTLKKTRITPDTSFGIIERNLEFGSWFYCIQLIYKDNMVKSINEDDPLQTSSTARMLDTGRQRSYLYLRSSPPIRDAICHGQGIAGCCSILSSVMRIQRSLTQVRPGLKH